MSDANGRRLPLQPLPLRRRLREPPGAERSWLSAVPFLRRCRRLFRLPHRAKAAAILVHPSIAARGATQAAAAGAARWPHHLKRQERGQEPRCVEGLGSRREEGAELPRWRERRVRRRRNAGRAGDGPGLPRAPCTHRRMSAGRCVRPSRPVFVISPAQGLGSGVEPASAGLAGLLSVRRALGVSGAESAGCLPAWLACLAAGPPQPGARPPARVSPPGRRWC